MTAQASSARRPVGPVERPAGAVVRPLDGPWALRTDPADAGLAAGWASAPLAPEATLPVPASIQTLDALAGAWLLDRMTRTLAGDPGQA